MESKRLKDAPIFKCLGYAGLAAVLITISACGTKKPKDSGDGTDVIPAATDSGTDAVPQPTAEVLPPTPNQPAQEPTSAASTPSTPSPPDQPDTYSVKSGDTLMKIAFEVYGDIFKWKEIFEANKDQVSDPNRIPKGVTLKITRPATPVNLDQNGEKYLIKKGDTLGKISDSIYGTKTRWKELWENNKQLIHDPNKIFAGFYLYYSPNSSGGSTLGSSTPPASTPTRGAEAGSATSAAPTPPAENPPQSGANSADTGGGGIPSPGDAAAVAQPVPAGDSGAPPAAAAPPNAASGS